MAILFNLKDSFRFRILWLMQLPFLYLIWNLMENLSQF